MKANICPTCKAPASKCYDKLPRRKHIPRCLEGDGKAQYSNGLCWTHFQKQQAIEHNNNLTELVIKL